MTEEAATVEQETAFRIGHLGRHSVIYGVGMLISKAVAVVMLPIYTRWLTPDDYGVLQLITMTFEVVTMIAGSRIALGIFHFYHKEERQEGKSAVLSTGFLLLVTTYAVAGLGTVYAAPSIAGIVFGEGELYPTFIRLAAVSMMFEGVILVPLAVFQIRDRSKLFVLVSLARLALQVTLNLIFLIPLRMGVAGVLWSSVVTHAVVGVVLGLRLLFDVGARFRWAAARSYIRFGLPLIVMQGATFIATFGDRYFLNRSGDTTEVGLYGLAYQFGFLVFAFGYAPFQTVWDPQRFAVAKRADRDEIFAQVFIYLNVLLFSAALGISLFAGDALRIIADPGFHEAAVYVPVLALAIVFSSWSGHLNLGIYVTEKTEYYTVAKWVAALVALAGYVWLIPEWLAWGATITTLVSLAVDAWLSHMFSQRLWRVEYRWRPVIVLMLVAVAVGAVSSLLPPLALWLSILAHALLYLLYCGLLWTLPILTDEERGTLLRLLARLWSSARLRKA